jgi:hypothetical protein
MVIFIRFPVDGAGSMFDASMLCDGFAACDHARARRQLDAVIGSTRRGA